MRRAAKVDANQPEIVAALRAEGWTVAHTHEVGGGFPDLVAAKAFLPNRRITLLIEVKNGRLPPSARELTPDQAIFHACWPGQLEVVNSVSELRALLQTVAEEA